MVFEAVDGPSALETSQPQLPDCVVLDIMMPGSADSMSSTELRARLATSAAGDPAHRGFRRRDHVGGMERGSQRLPAETFRPGALLDWIDRVLEGGGEMEPTL